MLADGHGRRPPDQVLQGEGPGEQPPIEGGHLAEVLTGQRDDQIRLDEQVAIDDPRAMVLQGGSVAGDVILGPSVGGSPLGAEARAVHLDVGAGTNGPPQPRSAAMGERHSLAVHKNRTRMARG